MLDASHSFPFEDVVVDDSPQGDPTTVIVLEGADVGTSGNGTGIRAFGHSIVDISGGSVGAPFAIGLLATDASRIRISGGRVGVGGQVELRGSATLEASGGFLGGLGIDEDARLTLTGGEVSGRVRLLGGPSEISGGFLHGGLSVGGEALLSGGVVDGTLNVLSAAKVSIEWVFLRSDLSVGDTAEVSLAGGVVDGDIEASQRGKIVIRGGQQNGRLDVEDEATVTFVGRDFAVTQNGLDVDVSGGEIPVAFGVLTGRLIPTGHVFMLFARDPGARILLERAPLVVGVEVNPRRKSKRIDPFSRGVVAVAILGSGDFDVASIDLGSLRFGPAGAPTLGRNGGRRIDVNRDGFADLVSLHRIPQTGIAVGDTEACVSGETLEGEPFGGCAEIEAVPPRALRAALQPRRR